MAGLVSVCRRSSSPASCATRLHQPWFDMYLTDRAPLLLNNPALLDDRARQARRSAAPRLVHVMTFLRSRRCLGRTSSTQAVEDRRWELVRLRRAASFYGAAAGAPTRWTCPSTPTSSAARACRLRRGCCGVRGQSASSCSVERFFEVEVLADGGTALVVGGEIVGPMREALTRRSAPLRLRHGGPRRVRSSVPSHTHPGRPPNPTPTRTPTPHPNQVPSGQPRRAPRGRLAIFSVNLTHGALLAARRPAQRPAWRRRGPWRKLPARRLENEAAVSITDLALPALLLQPG